MARAHRGRAGHRPLSADQATRSSAPYRYSVVAGAGDMGGNFFFVLANNSDALSVAVVLSSLYPIVTTILAAVVLRERLRPVQIAGVVLATLSVPLLR